MFKNILKCFTKNGKTESGADIKCKSVLAGIDEEVLEEARQLAFEKKLKRDVSAKWKHHKKGIVDDEDILEALRELKPDAAKIMRKVFARTVEDTVLANKFQDVQGNKVSHITVKKAAAMDGLRDLDDDVAVASAAASPMNPEGRFNVPTFSTANHQFAERFNEAMNPVRNGRYNSVIPELIMDHFANFSVFIGYPMCEIIACHPTVSNACTIPGEDAIAPGYNISFIDSEDMNDNGVPDELEVAELGGVKRSLGRIGAMEALKDAIVTLSGAEVGVGPTKGNEASLNALAVALERLAAYEEWERGEGAGENAAQAVNEGFIQPLSKQMNQYVAKQDDNSRKEALSALSLALADLSKKEHPALDEVRANQKRRGTVEAVRIAVTTFALPVEEWDSVKALNDLAVAVERVAAYEKLSDRNAEVMSALNMALIDYSLKQEPDTKEAAVRALGRAIEAMDEDEFDFDEPSMDGVSVPTEVAQEQAMANQQQAQGEASAMPNDVDPKQLMEAMQAQQQEAMMQQQMQAQQQQAEQQKKEQEEKREKTRLAAQVAKERQKYLDKWHQRADDMGINGVCSRLSRNARVFGIGIAIPIVDGVNYEEPMDFEKIGEGTYRGFTVVEPTWIYPEVDSDDLINPMSPTFFEPTYWCVTGSSNVGSLAIRRIHKSWMIIVRNKEVPNMLRPMYYYGGLSLCQEIYEAVFCADKLMNEVPKLAMTKRSVIVKGDPNDLITNPEGVVERLTAMSQVQDNFGMKFVGRNADVVQLETSLSEFDQVIAKANQRIASIAKMPETKLFKTQLAGMNSAGRYEWDDYSQLLINIQNNWYKPLLALHYKLDTKSRTGKVIELNISFNPIDVPTQAEKGETESRTIQTINSAIQGGWLAPAEARTIARSSEDSMFSSISAEMPEELEQAQQQQQQGGGMPGMGGEGGDPMAAMLGGAMGGNGGGGDGMPQEPEAPKGPEAPKDPMTLQEPKEAEAPKEPSFKSPSIKKM